MQTFNLIPCPASNLPQIQINGEVGRLENRLSIRYVVTGDTDSILIPAPANNPSRQHNLWKATCFEFFLGVKDRPKYWEFNMSPSSDWNVYVMDTYRQINMREEAVFTQLPFKFQKTSKELTLDISVDLNSILHADQPLQLGITTILQTTNGGESYWALTHPGPQADFHLRESFSLSC